jgi:hypothetical protein
MVASTRPDPSDAGMAYFLVTGDEDCDPAKLKRLIDEHHFAPSISARKQVRLEAENFRHFEGFVSEDRNDRNASHRLNVKLTERNAGRISTRFDEPFTSSRGRYNVTIRYLDEKELLCKFAFFVNDIPKGSAWESAGDGRGWMSHEIRAVEIRIGDELRVDAEGQEARLDYVQLDSARAE